VSFDLAAYMVERARAVDEALGRFLPAESAPPETLHRAMRYSVFAGGKRLRPVLVIAGAEAVGGSTAAVMPAACAVEMIHTYSLIHDDLPAMDNDDVRRGVPTSHKVFGEAIAILAGDALLTLAFRLLADSAPGGPDGGRRLHDVLVEIADAAGSAGMVGGQVADIESEGKKVGAETVDYIHTHKTAALIRASICAASGAIWAWPSRSWTTSSTSPRRRRSSARPPARTRRSRRRPTRPSTASRPRARAPRPSSPRPSGRSTGSAPGPSRSAPSAPS
jgi:geranylgeranyl diphosphate synthase type II